MNDIFKQHVEQLQAKYQALLQMNPATLGRLPGTVPNSGVYLFSEGAVHLYVGRSKRLRHRLRYHRGSAKDAPFAFKLAREQTGNMKASYSTKGSRGELLADPTFSAAFQAAKDRIRQMQIRFVEETDSRKAGVIGNLRDDRTWGTV